MTTVRAVIRDRRIDVPAPADMPDGTEVVLEIGTAASDDDPMTPEEIAHVLTSMQRLLPLEIPADRSHGAEHGRLHYCVDGR